MKFSKKSIRYGALVAGTLVVAACGGGGGSDTPFNGGGGSPAPAPGPAPTPMTCADGAGWQCGGSTVARVDNGIAQTEFGVQLVGATTSDRAVPNVTPTIAKGFSLTETTAAAYPKIEVRAEKNANSEFVRATLLLSGLGLSWDSRTERPLIVETFGTTKGRTTLDPATGALVNAALPEPTQTSFYDWVAVAPGVAAGTGTQANYANNRYFPRSEPLRCADPATCKNYETTGFSVQLRDWRNASGSFAPDSAEALRLHSDGDIYAGNTPANPLPGSDGGLGLPEPGTKGVRTMLNFNLRYSNVAGWSTLDTVNVGDWGSSSPGYVTGRRGIVAYGAVTPAAQVPTSGSVSYSGGRVYGLYASGPNVEQDAFSGRIAAVANLATGKVTITISDIKKLDSTEAPLPGTFTATVDLDAGGGGRNYFSGAVSAGAEWTGGGVGGRLFGPVTQLGGGGNGPTEIAGTFQLRNATTGASVIGGYLAVKK